MRRLLIAACVPALALALAGAAAASDGGFGPVTPQSPNAQSISTIYWVIFVITTIVFILILLGWFYVLALIILGGAIVNSMRLTPWDAQAR